MFLHAFRLSFNYTLLAISNSIGHFQGIWARLTVFRIFFFPSLFSSSIFVLWKFCVAFHLLRFSYHSFKVIVQFHVYCFVANDSIFIGFILISKLYIIYRFCKKKRTTKINLMCNFW